MASPIRPRRIPFTYRLQVWALRALMFVFKLSVPLRPKPQAPGPGRRKPSPAAVSHSTEGCIRWRGVNMLYRSSPK